MTTTNQTTETEFNHFRLCTPTGWTTERYANPAKAVEAAKLLKTTVRVINMDSRKPGREIADWCIVASNGTITISGFKI